MYLNNKEDSPVCDAGLDVLNAESNKTTKGSSDRCKSKPIGHLIGISTCQAVTDGVNNHSPEDPFLALCKRMLGKM